MCGGPWGGVLGLFGRPFGSLWGPFGLHLDYFGALWAPFGLFEGPLGLLLGALGSFLDVQRVKRVLKWCTGVSFKFLFIIPLLFVSFSVSVCILCVRVAGFEFSFFNACLLWNVVEAAPQARPKTT